MLHDVGNNRDCDVDVDHRNNTIVLLTQKNCSAVTFITTGYQELLIVTV